MRLLFLASAALLATTAGSAAPSLAVSDTPEVGFTAPSQPTGQMPVLNPNAPIGKACPPTSRYEAARRGAHLGAHKLNELPAADMYMAVDRQVDGCQAPIIARYGLGGAVSAGR
jgi:hypothetical protein